MQLAMRKKEERPTREDALRRQARRAVNRQLRNEERQFYLFILPWLIGFVLFGGGPIVASAFLSLTDWSLLDVPHWVGLQNYVQIFQDPLFLVSLKNTLYFGLGSVALSIVTSFCLALLLNQPVRGIAFFRTVFYLPSVVSGIATALLWVNIFHPDFGLINYILSWFGIQGPGWLTSEDWAIPALIIMSAWGAGSTMIVYLAGLQGIPTHLYEAAALDGAGWRGKLWHVTIPMMTPVIFFNMITGVIASLQSFVLILIMTGGSNSTSSGGPANATLVYGLYIYRQAFQYFNMGYASALAWILFLILMLVTLVQLRLARRWVHYEGALGGR